METKKENNLAFIDGQNLYLGTMTAKNKWAVDLAKFRIYLKKKYKVEKAYYFLGYIDGGYQYLYDKIQEAGFILKFKEHNIVMLGKKKGNVDSDIIFSIMVKMYRKENFDKIVLVSGDGDYKKLVDFLIEENKFKKILFPNKEFASSLYRQLGSEFYDWLENESIKSKIIRQKEKGSLGS